MSAFLHLLYSQFFVTPTYPTKSFEGQTIIVTGANVGLGREAVRHIIRLGAKKVIIAVRSTEKGEAARQEIEQSAGRQGVIEVWRLDLSSYDSVKEFAKKCDGLERLDCILENAGVATPVYRTTEDNESTITTNVVSTFLLALLILPKLRETAKQFHITPRLIIVASEVHKFTSFPEKNSDNIFKTLNDKESARMNDRYNVSKLLEVFTVRELAPLLDASGKPKVIISTVNPGWCHSELMRERMNAILVVVKKIMCRTTEVGSRTLVSAAGAGTEAHGQYLSDCHPDPPSNLVLSAEGAKVQKQLWSELSEKLEIISPGILGNI